MRRDTCECRNACVPRVTSRLAAANAGFQKRRTHVVRRMGPPSGAGKIQSEGSEVSKRATWSVSCLVTDRGIVTVRMDFAVLGGPTTTWPRTSEAVRRTRIRVRNGSKSARDPGVTRVRAFSETTKPDEMLARPVLSSIGASPPKHRHGSIPPQRGPVSRSSNIGTLECGFDTGTVLCHAWVLGSRA